MWTCTWRLVQSSAQLGPVAYLPVVLAHWQGIELRGYCAFKQENTAGSGQGTPDSGSDAGHGWRRTDIG